MLVDFREIAGSTTLRADVCLIGSGAAGITLAMELDRSGLDVVMLAGGAAQFDAACHDLYRSHVVGLRHKGIHEMRARIHGGTTTLWAGQALPLDPIDFEARDWVPYSGWPFDLEAMKPYYLRAEQVMKLTPMTYDESAWPIGLAKPPKFDPDVFFPRISQFADVCDFSIAYQKELTESRNVKVLLNAHATAIETDAGGTHVNRIAVRSLEGQSMAAEARFCVVCCGAIETARLLLASDGVDPRGVGNAHDLVGRFFQDHPQALVAPIRTKNVRSLRAMFDVFVRARTRYSPRFCASKTIQRQRKILNICGGVGYDYTRESAVDDAKLLARAIRRKELRPQVPRALWNVVRHPVEVSMAAARYALYRTPMTGRSGPPYLGLQAEQAPNPASRVTLDPERDALGMRRTRLDWRLTALDRHTMKTFVEATAAEFRRLDLGEIDVAAFDLPEDLSQMDQRVHDCAHHIGTTRMHDDPAQGVVDRNCRVHGVDNLYIGSSSVFPTGGSSNPTLTIIALCARIADRLKQECRAPQVSLLS
jgi:choline dehydrogenase-like flavoprotein